MSVTARLRSFSSARGSVPDVGSEKYVHASFPKYPSNRLAFAACLELYLVELLRPKQLLFALCAVHNHNPRDLYRALISNCAQFQLFGNV